MNQNALTKRVLAKITPTPEQQATVDALVKKLETKIAETAKNQGVTAQVRVEGSVAKGTWLAEDLDIDVFMRLPTTIPRKNLGEIGLGIAKKAVPDAEQLERYAEHPYLEVFVDGYRVDIVPCYDAASGEWLSATDRTPYHTDYIKTHLTPTLQSEVRLLKLFLKAVGVYGAEIKVGGFSGYLCELLTIHYGSFAKVIEAFTAYSKRVVIDIESTYTGGTRELELLFPEPLVVVDPIDKGRNVASAVQTQRLYEFIAAARAYQEAPSEAFFYPPPTHAIAPNLVESHLSGENTTHLYIAINDIQAVPDVLWGQLYRTKRALRKLLENSDFRVLRDAAWSNENSLNILIFELEQQVLPNVRKHLGPQLERQGDCEKFLQKYATEKTVVTGPYVEEGRWIVMVPRKYTDAAKLLLDKLQGDPKSVGASELVAAAISKEFKVLADKQILKIYTEHSDFAVFLTKFLSGKPSWLLPY